MLIHSTRARKISKSLVSDFVSLKMNLTSPNKKNTHIYIYTYCHGAARGSRNEETRIRTNRGFNG